jgi:dienelactone hydrolase
VLVNIYGEPAGQTTLDRWGGNGELFHRYIASLGYLVVSFDNSGTPAPRGRAWRKAVYGDVGVLSSKEQAQALRWLGAKEAFIDLDRVAVWGWSGGGTNTLNLMFRSPDLYKVGMAVAPVPDQRLYDSIYQERYMGLPQDNVDGYKQGSAINFAAGLKGHLLIVHGSGDDNVHYQGTELLVNRLIELGKPFDFMTYPDLMASAERIESAPQYGFNAQANSMLKSRTRSRFSQQLALSGSVLRHRREDIDARLQVHFYDAEEVARQVPQTPGALSLNLSRKRSGTIIGIT